jgi:hypothetical protein
MSDAEREEWKARTLGEHYGIGPEKLCASVGESIAEDPDENVWSPYVIRLGAVPGTWRELGIDPHNRASVMTWLEELYGTQHMTPDMTRIEWMPKGYGAAAPRTTCGSACPRHEHSCARSLSHGGECRDSRERGTEGCQWGPGLATVYTRTEDGS